MCLALYNMYMRKFIVTLKNSCNLITISHLMPLKFNIILHSARLRKGKFLLFLFHVLKLYVEIGSKCICH